MSDFFLPAVGMHRHFGVEIMHHPVFRHRQMTGERLAIDHRDTRLAELSIVIAVVDEGREIEFSLRRTPPDIPVKPGGDETNFPQANPGMGTQRA